MASFLVIDKASALEVTYDYDSDKLNLLDDNKEIVDNIVNIANDNNTNNYTFVIFFGRDSNGYHLSVGIGGYTCDNLYFGPYKNPYGYYLQSTVVQPGLNISLIKNFNQYYKFYFTDDLENFYNSISNVFLNGTTTNNGLLSQYASSNPFYSDYLSNSIFAIPVYSNVPIEYYQFNTSYNDTIKINEVVYSYGDTIPTYYDYAYTPKTPSVNVSIDKLENTTINNIEYISKERINMKFENYDITKHQIYIAHDVPHAFYEITPNFFSQKYSLDVDRNTTIYLKILDRESQENLYSTSINIRNISVPIPSLKLTLEETEYLNNDTSLPPLHYLFKAHFDYFNLDRYIYKYYYPDYDTIINITENDHFINVGVNGNLTFYVYDKKTNELVYTYTQNISGLFGTYFPQISIKHHEFEYLNCGDEKRVYSESVDIYFSILDSDKYIYEYSMNNVDFVEYNIKDYKVGYYFRYTVYSNSTLYVRVRDKNNKEVLSTNTYIINSITYDTNDVTCILGNNYNDNIKAMQKYLVELKETSQAFNDLFHSFYDNLPTFVQLGLVFAYIVLLIFITLIIGGWK